MKILMIDDNAEITKAFQKLMSLHKHDVDVSNNGPEGIEKIKKTKYDAILLDLSMPGFSGTDVINELKNSDLIQQNNVILLTASFLSDEDVDSLLGLGVKRVLKKPMNVKQILSNIEEIVA